MMAPAAAPPAIFAVSRPFSLWPFCTARALIATVEPSATTSWLKSILSAGTAPIFLLPEVTSRSEPRTIEPADATRRSPTIRSEARRASTGSSASEVLVDSGEVSSTVNCVPVGTVTGGGGGAGATAAAAGALVAGLGVAAVFGGVEALAGAFAAASRAASSASRRASSASRSRRASAASWSASSCSRAASARRLVFGVAWPQQRRARSARPRAPRRQGWAPTCHRRR